MIILCCGWSFFLFFKSANSSVLPQVTNTPKLWHFLKNSLALDANEEKFRRRKYTWFCSFTHNKHTHVLSAMRPVRLRPRSLHCSLSSSELPSSTWARQANILIKGRRKTAVQHCVSRYTGQQSWGPRTSTPPTLCPFWACTRRILIIQKTNKWHIACWCSLFCEYHKLSFLRLLSGRWKINPKMQDDSKWSGGFGRREGGVDLGGGVSMESVPCHD